MVKTGSEVDALVPGFEGKAEVSGPALAGGEALPRNSRVVVVSGREAEVYQGM